MMQEIKGIGASNGFALGPVRVINRHYSAQGRVLHPPEQEHELLLL